MIISDEQVQRALEYLQTADTHKAADDSPSKLDPEVEELVARIRATLSDLPEVRPDRIAEARELLAHAIPTSKEVADKLLGRLVSDSLR